MDWNAIREEGYTVILGKNNKFTIKNKSNETVLDNVSVSAVRFWWEFG